MIRVGQNGQIASLRSGLVRLPAKEPARITFVCDLFGGDQARTDRSIRVLLRALTAIDILWLLGHPSTPGIYESGVVYCEEPPGAEDWQDIPTCLRMGWGDCEDLACWLAAEYQVHGVDAEPFASAQKLDDGTTLYHIQVRLPDGRIEDPSRKLGMR